MSPVENSSSTAIAAPVAPIAYSAFAVFVADVRELGGSFLRVTFRGNDLTHFHALGLDQRIKLVLPNGAAGLTAFPRDTDDWYTAWRDIPEEQRPVLRTYTVRAARPEMGELDVDFVVHGQTGPATRWVRAAMPGDEIILIGPDSRTREPHDERKIAGAEFAPGDAGRLLLAGDETAAPAICSILESLPRKTRGQVFIEVPTTEDILPVNGPGGVAVCWLARDARPTLERGQILDRAVRSWVSEMMPTGRAAKVQLDAERRAAFGLEVVEAVSSAASASGCASAADTDELNDVDVDHELLWEVPDADGSRDLYAWLAGEAGCIKELRRFLVRDTGLHRSDVAFMEYWRLGRSEN